jgi:eukaryotic-like serine/threonine-protein kinase
MPPATRIPALDLLRGSGLDTDGGRPLLQWRVALLGRVLLVLSIVWFGVGIVTTLLLHHAPTDVLWEPGPRRAYLFGASTAAAIWLICRRGSYPNWLLETMDALLTIGCCAAWAFLIQPGEIGLIFGGLIAVFFTTLARAIVVPSKPGRTLRVSLISTIPVLVASWRSLEIFAGGEGYLATMLDLIGWAAMGIALSTLASRVIYGLRKSASDAAKLGQYTLEKKLGEGGMGVVWHGRHRLLARPAAIKVIPLQGLAGHGDASVLVRRFEREARATAALTSPHTVQLYDFGQADDGSLYYAMELLRGTDLESLVHRFGPVPPERAIHIIRQICQSLIEAHDNGLVHRDIKPANIFLSRLGTEVDFVKVLDFGLVHLRDNHAGVKLTADGSISGTPAYIAPEVALGEGSYDHRADIYALGCVAYWLLSGKLVFDGETPMKMLMQHVSTPAPRLSTRTEIPIPAELEALVMQCLEKDPARRPGSAAEIVERLSKIAVAHPWTPERAATWWRVHLPEQVHTPSVAEDLVALEGLADTQRQEARCLRPVPTRI